MISYQSAYEKAQFICGDDTDNTLAQLQQDINIGYKRFNNAIARYFTRKQQFTNLVEDQQYYQSPIDMIRPSLVSVLWTSSFEYPLRQVRSEQEWRELNTYSQSSMPTAYFVYGNNQIGLFPKPSQDVTNGLRLVYQPQDVDLTKNNYTTGTVTIVNGSTSVAGASTVWAQTHVGMFLQVTDGTDGNWYEIDAVSSTTALTLKTPYAGSSVTSTTYTLGQMFIFPGEYDDVPVDYALSRFYESRNNPSRANYHLQKFTDSVTDAVEKYASSSMSNVITGEEQGMSLWLIPPLPGS